MLMLVMFVALGGLAAAILAWLSLGWSAHGYRRYRQAFQAQARDQLRASFLFIDPSQLWLALVAACLVLLLLVALLTGSLLLPALLAVPVLLAPALSSRWLRQRRLLRFERQLPDFLLALSGALRAGSGLQGAMQIIIVHTPAPLGQEFSLLLREQRMGVSLETALANLRQRMPAEGMVLLASLLSVAGGLGGNLAETLERIAQTLRERQQLQGKIQALTAQGRMQAWIMAGLPPLLAVALSWLQPDAMAPLWRTPAGWAVLGLILLLEVSGVLMIRRIVRIDV